MSSGVTGTRVELAPGGRSECGDDGCGRDDGRRLADALRRRRARQAPAPRSARRRPAACRASSGSGSPVKLAFVISPSRVWISSISASPRPCAVPPSIWPVDRLRVHRLADVLRGADPDDAREPELDVDLGDDAHRRARVGDVRALAGDLSGLRIERRRARMAVDPLDVDLLPPVRSPAPRAPPGRRRARRRPPSRSCATPTPTRRSRPSRSCAAASTTSFEPSSVRATCRITFATPWPTSAAAQCTSADCRRRCSRTRAARVVVEAFGVADVLEADGEADAASHAFAAGRVARAAGQAHRVARQLLRLGDCRARLRDGSPRRRAACP